MFYRIAFYVSAFVSGLAGGLTVFFLIDGDPRTQPSLLNLVLMAVLMVLANGEFWRKRHGT